jgi:hypothetical protein
MPSTVTIMLMAHIIHHDREKTVPLYESYRPDCRTDRLDHPSRLDRAGHVSRRTLLRIFARAGRTDTKLATGARPDVSLQLRSLGEFQQKSSSCVCVSQRFRFRRTEVEKKKSPPYKPRTGPDSKCETTGDPSRGNCFSIADFQR